jgi:hypothetical protein
VVQALRRDARAGGRRRDDPALARALRGALALLAAVLLAGAGARRAQAPPGIRTTQVGEVTVLAGEREEAVAVALAERAQQPREWPGLGRRAPGPFRLVLLPDAAALARWTGGRAPPWGAALALPKSRTIILRADADPTRTLQHELAHLVLNEAHAVRVPLWFDEGYAVWAAGEWDLLRQLELNLAVATSATPSLDTLNLALRGQVTGVNAAYALAASAVLELARRNPDASIGPLVERLAAGAPFPDAVLATTGLTLDRFDEAWRKTVRSRFSLVTWLVAGGAWAILGLVVLVAMRVRRQADRPRRLALDEGWEVPTDTEEEPDAEPQVPDSLDPPQRGE